MFRLWIIRPLKDENEKLEIRANFSNLFSLDKANFYERTLKKVN